jgi:macrolide phosphotransferase
MQHDPSSNDNTDEASVRELAARHGLTIAGPVHINELGLDFRVVTAADTAGMSWILRVPRRPDAMRKIDKEARTLSFLQSRLPFAVPDWRIVTPKLVAYPMLTDTTAIVVDAATGAVEWKIDQESPVFADSFARALAALHAVPVEEAAAAGMQVRTPEQARRAVADDVFRVRSEFAVSESLLIRWQTWLDDDSCWPDFCVPVHGDLYLGHTLVDRAGRVTGMIDWTEARVDDPAIDMSSHLMLFGEAGLEKLLSNYAAAGGRVWPRMAHQVAERQAVFPVTYALFALESGDDKHTAAVKQMLVPR